MINDYTHKKGIVYKNQFHIIFCPKYRRKVLVDGVDIRLKEILFDIAKGVKDWEKLYCEADNCNFNFKKIYKEDKNTPLNLNNINACNPDLLELKDIDAFLVIREFLNENIKFIFKRNNNPDLSIEELKKLGFDYYNN